MTPSQIDPGLFLSQANSTKVHQKEHQDNPEELHKICQEFEAIFIQALFKTMRATIPDSGLLEKNIDSEVFEEMMDIEIARQTARKQEMGIAEVLFRQLHHPKDIDKDK